jgi:hypothetical protein
MSRNPFLSTFEAEFNKEAKRTDLIDMSATMKASPKKSTFNNGSAAEELFVRLSFPQLPLVKTAATPTGMSHLAGCISQHRIQNLVVCHLRCNCCPDVSWSGFCLLGAFLLTTCVSHRTTLGSKMMTGGVHHHGQCPTAAVPTPA